MAVAVRCQPATRPGLEATTYFQPEGEVWSFGAMCLRCGSSARLDASPSSIWSGWTMRARSINPLLAEGQLHGSLAQGLGQTLIEESSTTTTGSS